MKFIDEGKIEVHAGKGGDGAATFRREKYIRYGGPNGGDGGRGGSVWARAERNINTLVDYRFARIHRAENGVRGMGSDCDGRAGRDIELRVPVGTVIRDEDDGAVLADLPGLIEGASEGAGLGHQFLRHLARTRLLLHIVDVTAPQLVHDIRVIAAELKK